MSVPEVAERLGVGQRSAWRLIAENRLQTIKIGRRRLVSPQDLDEFIAKSRGGAL